MSHFTLDELLDEDFDPLVATHGRTAAGPKRVRAHAERWGDHAVLDEILAHSGTVVGAEAVFTPTFSSSRYERVLILNNLGPFFDRKLIGDVLRRVRGGKEANVYCCTGGVKSERELVAAKVYRPRQFRSLRNDAQYRQGREILSARGKPIRDRRALLAARTGTRVGKELQHTSWLAHEYLAMTLLFAAGVRVPRPLDMADNTILMEYAGTRETPAPTLQEAKLERGEAHRLFERLMADVARMLAAGRVHADLSAFNVLYAAGDYWIIDFPQAVDPEVHPDAYPLFRRDVTRLCQYFARQGITSDPDALAAGLWEEHGPKIPPPELVGAVEEEDSMDI